MLVSASLPHRLREEGHMSSQRSVTRDYFPPRGSLLTPGTLLLLLVHGSLGRGFVFPGEEDQNNSLMKDDSKSNVKCPEHMIWTKEGNEAKGFCACVPGNLYSPEFERCFTQYTQGPCKNGEHFLLRANETVAKCVDNPCPELDKIPYKGKCHELYVTGGPCGPTQTLKIPDESYEPECVDILPVNRNIINAPCRLGFRKDSNGKCRRILY